MEEIVTVDGKQFKLTVDRPLTATERTQVLAEIRKQTGCSTCGPRAVRPRMANMGSDWQYGGIKSMGLCAVDTKGEGDTVTLKATPDDGTGPYNVRFWRKPNAVGAMAFGELGSVRTNVAEGSTTSTSFTIYDTDYVAATGDTLADIPTTDTTGQISDPAAGGTAALATGSIRVATTIYDSCPTEPQTCIDWCDISLVCVAPTCNFVVS